MGTAPTQQNGTLASHAAACVEAGLCALPALRRGDEKRVALSSWKPYQTRLPESSEIETWFTDSTSAMCLVCGAVSGNLEMIDFDLGGEAFDAWADAVERVAPGLVDRLVIETSPSGGRHAIYRCQEAVTGNMKLAQRRVEVGTDEPIVIGAKTYIPRKDASGESVVVITMIETRGERGLFLCAPSDGYEILQGDLCQPPAVTADERDVLLGCAWALDEMPKPIVDGASGVVPTTVIGVRPGDDYSDRGDPRDVLRAHGWKLVRGGENEYWRRPGKTAGTSATLKDNVFYVFSTNAPPFEAHKGYSPFAVYALLEHNGDFTAAASALATDGFGSTGEVHGVDLSAFIKDAPVIPEDALVPAPIAVCDLVESHPRLRAPVIHGLLREGETMNVIASPKTGKSWLTLDLAIAVATGRPWLGQYATEAGDILIIDNELHRETSAHRIPMVASARNVAMREFGRRIHIDNLRGRLRDIEKLEPYFLAIEPGRFKIIVLDAFYRFMPLGGDENDNGMMASIYNRIDAFADRLRCCFVLIHHSTKGSQSGKSVTDVGAGAGAQSRATDTHLVLRPHEESGVVVLDAAVRSWAPIEPTCLRWSFPVWTVEDGLDPTQLKSERPGRKKERTPKQPEGPKDPPWTVERVVEAFIPNDPITLAELREKTADQPGLSWRRANDLIEIAETRGLIERQKLPGRGGPIGFVRQQRDDSGGDP